MNFNDERDVGSLAEWFSPERMSTYSHHPDPEALYLWNTHVTKALLEDIQHVEVLLRNRVDSVLARRYGEQWFHHTDIPFREKARRAIRKAEGRAQRPGEALVLPGRVIAELSLDFWVYLFTNAYKTTIWPRVHESLNIAQVKADDGNTSSGSLPSLKSFKREVDVIYHARNRCAHHEPIINQNKTIEDNRLDKIQNAIETVTRWINPDAAEWVAKNSRVTEIRKNRP